jgi:putative glycerol-1-phosphate prenyltransferase
MASTRGILNDLLEGASQGGKKLLAVLIDPDKFSTSDIQFIENVSERGADAFLIGGSLMMSDKLNKTIELVKNATSKPVYLFPSSPAHIDSSADGILFLSLLSGRNPELLIGKHVEAAPQLQQTDLHVMSTGYLLVNCGNQTTAHYMSQSLPIPFDKPEIAQATALAGEYLGMQCVYLDGGSGAQRPISSNMIREVRAALSIPIIVGGGIRDRESAQKACEAGADMIVVGTAFEDDPELFQDISIAVHSCKVEN